MVKEGKIAKSFLFSSFIDAIEFVNKVAKVYPIITITWKAVRLSLKSFDVDAVTKRDINLAKEIEKIVTV